MTDLIEKVSHAATIQDAFRALADADHDLIVLHVTSGNTEGQIWVNRSRRLFYAKANGDGGNGMLAMMMLLAAKEPRFRADIEQPIAHKPNIDEPIFVGELVADLPDVVKRVKDILWPVQAAESDIQTEASMEALPPEMLNAIMFQTAGAGFFDKKEPAKAEEPPIDDILEEMTADVEIDSDLPDADLSVVQTLAPTNVEPEHEDSAADDSVPMLISEEELAGYSMIEEAKPAQKPIPEPPLVQQLEQTLQLPTAEQPVMPVSEPDQIVEPEPVVEVEPEPVAEVEPEPVAEVEPEPGAEVEAEQEIVSSSAPVPPPLSPEPIGVFAPPLDQAQQPVAEFEPPPERIPEPVAASEPPPEPAAEAEPSSNRGFTLADLNAIKTPQAQPSAPMLGDAAAEAEVYPAPTPAPAPTFAAPLNASGRFAAPTVIPAAERKGPPIAAITTIAAAVVIVGAVAFTIFSGITNGAGASTEDTQATVEYVKDTIELKQPPPTSK